MNKVMLVILDGFGINEKSEGNAIKRAKTPFIDSLYKDYSSSQLHTSGLHVGLPDGQMGNSEVGHVNIGAGRIVYQESTRISKSISDGDFYNNQTLKSTFENAKKTGKNVHLMGLLSDGGVHSHIDHLFALLEFAKRENVKDVFVHAFMDGRDTAPDSGMKYMKQLYAKFEELSIGKLASVGGRYFGMDRDNRWKRVNKAYKSFVGKAEYQFKNGIEGIESSYKNDIFDEFIEPFNIIENNEAVGKIENEDTVISFNFRADRAREYTKALAKIEFNEFEREFIHPNVIQFTEYDSNFPLETVFKPTRLTNILGEIISKKGYKQLRCAETEKYAHITFFFNGGEETVYDGEERILIKSPDVDTYDMRPEMSAREVTDALITSMEENKFDFIAVNYANSDMVGHTGIFTAAVKAIEALDKNLSMLIPEALKNGFKLLITADHGNSEQMIDYETNAPFTQHTTGPVPLFYIDKEKRELRKDGTLSDLAPTILELMTIKQPSEMTGSSLFK